MLAFILACATSAFKYFIYLIKTKTLKTFEIDGQRMNKSIIV